MIISTVIHLWKNRLSFRSVKTELIEAEYDISKFWSFDLLFLSSTVG